MFVFLFSSIRGFFAANTTSDVLVFFFLFCLFFFGTGLLSRGESTMQSGLITGFGARFDRRNTLGGVTETDLSGKSSRFGDCDTSSDRFDCELPAGSV